MFLLPILVCRFFQKKIHKLSVSYTLSELIIMPYILQAEDYVQGAYSLEGFFFLFCFVLKCLKQTNNSPKSPKITKLSCAWSHLTMKDKHTCIGLFLSCACCTCNTLSLRSQVNIQPRFSLIFNPPIVFFFYHSVSMVIWIVLSTEQNVCLVH